MILFISIATVLYLVLMVSFTFGYNRLKTNDNLEAEDIKVSIIIPFRDEEENLPKLIMDLKNQNYPSNNFELVFVNDHSEDSGLNILEKLLSECSLNYQILYLKESFGKKEAIRFGINHSNGELIITTDADCSMGKYWIRTLVGSYEEEKADLIIGPVKAINPRGILQKLLSLELDSIIAIGGAASGLNKAFICNGANMAFPKTLFNELNPYAGNIDLLTGDDVFLLYKLKEKKNKDAKIIFLKSELALVSTILPTTLSALINQRIRWFSKVKRYRDRDSILISFIIGIINLALFACFIGSILGLFDPILLLSFLAFKWLVDVLFLISVKNPRIYKNLFISLLLSIIYPLYSIGIAILSIFVRVNWKGRKIS